MKVYTGLFAAAAAALVGGAGGAAAAEASSAGPEAHAAAASVGAPVRAIGTARRSAGGTPYSIDREHGAWEVELVQSSGRSRERLISSDGRRVLRSSTTRRPAAANQARGSRVSLATAVRTASSRGRGRLEGADPDREHGQNTWSVIFLSGGRETEVHINSSSGRIIKVEHD